MRETRVRIAADHPAVDGHFPGRPMVPGALLLGEVLAAVESATGRAPDAWTLVSAKFHRVVQPGCELHLRHESTSAGEVHFEVRADGEIVASGRLAPA